MAGPAGELRGIRDPARLARWIAGHGGGHLGDLLAVRPIAGGRSNLTYRLDLAGGPLMLRRPPLGNVLPTAHDMSREHRVLSALNGSAVPVPAPLGLCADAGVIGAPFLLMQYVDGAACYADLTGRDVSGIGYYMAFGCFKLAVVLEGIHARYLRRQTVGDGFEREGPAVPVLIDRAHRVLDSYAA